MSEVIELEAEEIPSEEQIEKTLEKVEEQISSVLVKRNITDAVINEMKEKYMPLKIQNFEDREGYEAVKDARKVVKKMRISVSKICKAGREEALRVQKAWKSKEDVLVGQIEAVETHLEKQEKEFEAERERRKAEEKARLERQLTARTIELNQMGVVFNGQEFVLGGVAHDLSSVRDTDEEIYQNMILSGFKAEYERINAERIEMERQKAEAEEKLRKEREEFERQQAEFKRQQEEFRLQKEKEEAERRQRELEEQRKLEEEKKKRYDTRAQSLLDIGFQYKLREGMFTAATNLRMVDHTVKELPDEDFDQFLADAKELITQFKAEEERKKQAELERQKEIERKIASGKARLQALTLMKCTSYTLDQLSEMTEEAWREVYDKEKDVYNKAQIEEYRRQEELKRQEEERKRQEEMETANEKTKWEDVVAHLEKTPIYEMRSRIYRVKMKAVKDFLETIK